MYESEWDDDLDDEEYPDEWEDGDDDEVDLIPCSHCGAEIYEETEQCPICGEYVTHSRTNVAWGWRVTAVIVLAGIAYYLFITLASVL